MNVAALHGGTDKFALNSDLGYTSRNLSPETQSIGVISYLYSLFLIHTLTQTCKMLKLKGILELSCPGFTFKFSK